MRLSDVGLIFRVGVHNRVGELAVPRLSLAPAPREVGQAWEFYSSWKAQECGRHTKACLPFILVSSTSLIGGRCIEYRLRPPWIALPSWTRCITDTAGRMDSSIHAHLTK